MRLQECIILSACTYININRCINGWVCQDSFILRIHLIQISIECSSDVTSGQIELKERTGTPSTGSDVLSVQCGAGKCALGCYFTRKNQKKFGKTVTDIYDAKSDGAFRTESGNGCAVDKKVYSHEIYLQALCLQKS